MSAVSAELKRDVPWAQEPTPLLRQDLDELLVWAAGVKASDVMLMTDEPVLVRIDGSYRRVTKRRLRTAELGDLLTDIASNNSMARLAGAEAQDFAYEVQVSRDHRFRYRVNATAGASAYTSRGVDITLRVAPGVPPTVEEIGLEQEIVDEWDKIAATQGLFLMVGATGTGKSTTLSALLRRTLCQPPGRKIITYEAPIEHNLAAVDGKVGTVIQTQIPDHVRSFDVAVANSLRRAPNVILIGEARDQDTISGLVIAALTGHAVATTLHATSVPASLPRLVSVFPATDQRSVLSRVLDVCRAIVTQRLVPRIGGGRVALREYLFLDADLREALMREDPDTIQPALYQALRERGQTLLADARRKHAEGLITEVEVDLIDAEQGSRAVAP